MLSCIIKRAVLCGLFCVLFTEISAQSHRLLWFTGKRLNDSTLQTAAGYRVTYSPSRGSVRVNSGGGGIVATIAARLKTREKFKQQVIRIITQAPGGQRNIDLANHAASTIDDVDRSFEKNVAGEQDMKLGTVPRETGSSKMVPPWVQNNFDEVVNYVITEKGKKKEDPLPPPAMEFDYCRPCDEQRQQQYKKDTSAYFKDFFQDHAGIISKGFSVIRYFDHRKITGLPYDSVAAERMISKMNDDIRYLVNQLAFKVSKAWELYSKNAASVTLLSEMVVNTARQFELLAMPLPEGFPGLGKLGEVLTTSITAHFEDARQKRIYPVLLNITWLMGLLRQIALIHGDAPVNENITKFLTANRFEMIIDAEAQIGKGGENIVAKMTGSNFYRAVPDKDCKLRWYLIKPDENKMLFKLEKAELNMGNGGKYVGTRDWQTPPAKI